MSATSAKVADIRKAMADAKKRTDAGEGGTILFLDEFHALAKNQQDTLLPAVEDSTIILIGATTENPHPHPHPRQLLTRKIIKYR